MVKLISDAYQKLNYELHRSEPKFGANSAARAPSVAEFVRTTVGARSLLDYGCGKGTLKPALQALCPDLDIREYDPAVPGKTAQPIPADMVVCFDVFEHVEPHLLDDVLGHIHALTQVRNFFAISCTKSSRTLSDGRNAHLIIEQPEWWLSRLTPLFEITQKAPVPDGFVAVAVPKKRKIEPSA